MTYNKKAKSSPMTLSTDYEHSDESPPDTPHSFHYRIYSTDKTHDVNGFLGINENYVAVASLEGRMIWGMPLKDLIYFEKIEDPQPITNTRN